MSWNDNCRDCGNQRTDCTCMQQQREKERLEKRHKAELESRNRRIAQYAFTKFVSGSGVRVAELCKTISSELLRLNRDIRLDGGGKKIDVSTVNMKGHARLVNLVTLLNAEFRVWEFDDLDAMHAQLDFTRDRHFLLVRRETPFFHVRLNNQSLFEVYSCFKLNAQGVPVLD